MYSHFHAISSNRKPFSFSLWFFNSRRLSSSFFKQLWKISWMLFLLCFLSIRSDIHMYSNLFMLHSDVLWKSVGINRIKHNFHHFSTIISFIIVMPIFVMENNLLCNGIHTYMKTKCSAFTAISYRSCIIMDFLYFLLFFHFYDIISSDTQISKSLAIRFYPLVLIFCWFNKSFLLAIRFLFLVTTCY